MIKLVFINFIFSLDIKLNFIVININLMVDLIFYKQYFIYIDFNDFILNFDVNS